MLNGELAYEFSPGPWQLPTIAYETPGGDVLEVRNYKPLVVGNGATFRQTESPQAVAASQPLAKPARSSPVTR